jgi:colanic acid biosynthesis glycosyl transferase WcaI
MKRGRRTMDVPTRHVLILAPHFPPDSGSAANLLYDLGAALAQRGDRVTVVAPMPDYHVLGACRRYRGLRVVEQLDGMHVVRVATVAARNWLPGRALSEFASAAAVGLAALSLERPDVAIVYSPPLPFGLAGCLVRSLRGPPFVLNVQDLVPRAMVDLGVLRSRAVISGYEAIERFVYRQAAHTTVHSAGNLSHVLSRGLEAGRASIIPNWVDLAAIDAGTGLGPALRDEWNLGDRIVAFFGGVIGRSQDLDVVVEAARRGRDDSRIAWLIVGDGVALPGLEERAQGLTNVHFRPMQSRECYAALLDASDIGLVTLRAEVRSPVVPSKILSLMAAARPVVGVLAKDSDAARLIEESDCGVVVAHGDARGLSSAVGRLAADPAERRRLGANGRRHVAENLAVDVVVRRWDTLLDRVAGRRRTEVAG